MRPITIDHPAGDEAFGRLSSAANLPTAVACINDQVTVVSFGGGIFAQIVSPALTSVNQNYSELAQQTVEVLLAGIAGEKTPAPSVSPPFWSNGNRAGHSAQALRRGAALELERLTTGPKGGESALDRGHLLFVTTEMPPMPLDILIHLHPALWNDICNVRTLAWMVTGLVLSQCSSLSAWVPHTHSSIPAGTRR